MNPDLLQYLLAALSGVCEERRAAVLEEDRLAVISSVAAVAHDDQCERRVLLTNLCNATACFLAHAGVSWEAIKTLAPNVHRTPEEDEERTLYGREVTS